MEVFVYGTLTDPDRAETVLEEFSFEGAATLVGLRRVRGRYPTLAPPTADDESSVEGRVLATPDVAALDAYEGVASGLYVRTTVPATDGRGSVYVGDPDLLGAPADWPGEGPFAGRVEQYVERTPVSVRRDG